MSWSTIAMVCVMIALTPGAASAQDASQLYRRGAAEYGAGRYAEAAELFAEAYALSPEPSLLYNLGLAREQAGEVDGAIEAYSQFLSDAPDAAERSEVERSLTSLERQRALRAELAQREADAQRAPDAPRSTPADPVLAPTPSVERDRGVAVAGFVVAGVGVLALIAGGVLGAVAQSTYDAARVEPQHERATRLERDAHALATATNATLISAGAVALIGVTIGSIALAIGSSEESVTVSVGPGTVRIAGRF